MGKLQPTGQKQGRRFSFKSGYFCASHLWCYQVKLPNLKLTTWPKQLLGSLLLDIALPIYRDHNNTSVEHYDYPYLLRFLKTASF